MPSGYLIPSGKNYMVTALLMCFRGCLMQSKFSLSAYYWNDQFVEASAVLMY